jgi:hypothetical protein
MMNTIVRALILTAVLFALGSISIAQNSNANTEYDKYVTLLRKDLRSDKKQFLALNLPMTETEAVKFWPVYEQYAGELAKIFDVRIVLLKEFAANINTLTDASAGSLLRRMADNDEQITRLRQKYVPIVMGVIPGKKAALFFQLEKRLGLLIDLQLASEVPLVMN